AEAQKATERQFQETDRRFQEIDRLLKERSQESDRRSQEADCILKRQNQQFNEQLGNCLDEFAEWQVRPAVVRLFQERGIAVHEFCHGSSAWRGDERIEIDLLVANTTDAILVGVKIKLTQANVDEHLERLGKFKRLMPRYGDVRAMGAVAAMVVPDEVARYAYRQGLFVLAQSGDSVVILNEAQFQPQSW
ncbi:MAG: DUF3782 domain-containing protein, partial [Nodosilinea sp.]